MRLRPLPCLISLLCLPGLALADEAVELPQVMVTTATKTERALDASTVSVQVISETEIQELGAVTLRDVFLNIGGVHVDPGRETASIRGVGGTGTLWLLDGRRIAGEVGGSYELDRISAASIERIEIVKGPMSVLYGADSLGGVINIITKRPREKLEGTLDFSGGANTHGDAGKYTLAGDLRGGHGATEFSLNLSAIRNEPYTERETAQLRVSGNGKQIPPSQSPVPAVQKNLKDSYPQDVSYRDQAEIYTLGGRLTQRIGERVKIGLEAALLKETRDGYAIGQNHPTNYTTPQGRVQAFNVPVHQTDDNERVDLAATLDFKASDQLDFAWRSYRSHYKKINEITAVHWRDMGYSSETASASTSQNATVTLLSHELTATWRPAAAHTVLAGAEYRDEDREATTFNTLGTAETRHARYQSLYSQHEWAVRPDFDFVWGLRHDDISNAEAHTSFKAGAIYTFTPRARLRANFAQGFRAADLRELFINRYTPSGRLLGSEVVDATLGKTATELKPETSNNVEIGLGGKDKNWRYDIALFHNEIKDRIEQMAEAPRGVAYRSFRNVSEARIQGTEASAGLRLMPGLWLNASATVLEAENQQTGQRLEFTPRQLFTVSADYSPNTEYKFKLIVQHTGDQYYTLAREGKTQGAMADAYTFVNLKASWLPKAVPDTEFYAGVDNLFDQSVDPILGSAIGPYLYIGARHFF